MCRFATCFHSLLRRSSHTLRGLLMTIRATRRFGPRPPTELPRRQRSKPMKYGLKRVNYAVGLGLAIAAMLSPAITPVFSSGDRVAPAETDRSARTNSTRRSILQPFLPATSNVLLPAPPSNHTIAFASDQNDGNFEIYTIHDDGTALTRLTTNSSDDVSPAITRDGSMIAFVSNRDGNTNIYIMDATGNNQTQL